MEPERAANFEFCFTLSRAEHLRAFDDLHPLKWWHLVPWITEAGGRARLRAGTWIAGALLIVLVGPLLFVRSSPRVALVGPLLLASAFLWLAALRALRRRAAMATYDRTPALQREQRWLLNHDGLEVDYGEGRTKLPWREVMRIEEIRDGFGFVVSLQRTGVLPKRAIEPELLSSVRELISLKTTSAVP